MSVRDTILNNIRTSIGAKKTDEQRRKSVEDRLKNHPIGVIPARAQLNKIKQVKLFCQQAEKVSTTIRNVRSYQGVPRAVSEYLRQRNLPAGFRMGSDPRLAGLPWQKTPALEIKTGTSDGNDLVGLAHAFGVVAESGTLLLVSGKDNPTSSNFLPETHIIVTRKSDVVGDYEALWTSLRKTFGPGKMPRTVNWITGPSRSADIQQTLLLGAHGPKALHVIIVDE